MRNTADLKAIMEVYGKTITGLGPEHINQYIKRRFSQDKDSTVHTNEYRSKTNQTFKETRSVTMNIFDFFSLKQN